MKAKVFIVNSFTKIIKGGNPSGVVLAADKLSDNDMQRIAKKVGLSETAFVQKSNKADFKIRFFSPNMEVFLCGHATIAAFYLLNSKKIIMPGKYKQETKAGVLGVDIFEKGVIFMSQKPPEFLEILEEKIVLDCLDISRKELISSLPIQIVSTGFPSILIPVKSLSVMGELKPDFKKCKRLSKNSLLVHVFTLETVQKNSIAFSRNFFPIETLDEETATGSSTGALACYLYKYNLLPKDSCNNLIFEQGYFMNRLSEILVKLKIEGNKIKGVQVGGTAILNKEIDVLY